MPAQPHAHAKDEIHQTSGNQELEKLTFLDLFLNKSRSATHAGVTNLFSLPLRTEEQQCFARITVSLPTRNSLLVR